MVKYDNLGRDSVLTKSNTTIVRTLVRDLSTLSEMLTES
jgi:hypothetical protein